LADANGRYPAGDHRSGARWFPLGGRGSCRAAGFSSLKICSAQQELRPPEGRKSCGTTLCQHPSRCNLQLHTGFRGDPFFAAEGRGVSRKIAGWWGGYVATTNDTNTNRWRFECLVSRIALALIFELLRAQVLFASSELLGERVGYRFRSVLSVLFRRRHAVCECDASEPAVAVISENRGHADCRLGLSPFTHLATPNHRRWRFGSAGTQASGLHGSWRRRQESGLADTAPVAVERVPEKRPAESGPCKPAARSRGCCCETICASLFTDS
jgi:hypothetical protein